MLTNQQFNKIISLAIEICRNHALTVLKKSHDTIPLYFPYTPDYLNKYLIELRKIYSPNALPDIYEAIYARWFLSNDHRVEGNWEQENTINITLAPFDLNRIANTLNSDFKTNYVLEEIRKDQDLVVRFNYLHQTTFFSRILGHASDLSGQVFLGLCFCSLLLAAVGGSAGIVALGVSGIALSSLGFFATMRPKTAPKRADAERHRETLLTDAVPHVRPN